jgi:hypothetical protein
MTTTTTKPRTKVIDCPAYAWRNVAEAVKDAWYAKLDADFVHDHRAQLDTAATALFGPLLLAEWTRRGYQVTPAPDGETMQRRPKGFPHHQVWDQACRDLDPYAVVHAACLDDVLLEYVAHRPRVEHLQDALDGLRPHHSVLRADLEARLDRFAETATSPQAEAQLDGWRSLLDTAATRAQLDQLDTDIPA